jgi:glycosyltransferase involved in cell wall biosynthesis
MTMSGPNGISVLHIGSGKYRPFDRGHVTYAIWRELASRFREYHVIARSAGAPADWCDGNLRITLLRSWTRREAEFMLSQFAAVRAGISQHPDVIVCQSPNAGGMAAVLIARVTGARLLIELHSDVYFKVVSSKSKDWLVQKIARLVLPAATAVRVLSPRMGRELARVYGENVGLRSKVVPPRVDLSLFGNVRKACRSGPLRLIMIGSVSARKGQLRLVEGLQSLPFPAELRIVGDGPDLRECKARAARAANLAVRFEGAVPQADLPEMLGQSDLFVLYSNSEGTPRAMMEAMACGLPVVTTNAGFCADIVEDGVEGFVLGPDPDSEIIDVLRRFNDDRDLLSRMGAAARERARRDYDSVRLFDEYRRLIAETANA